MTLGEMRDFKRISGLRLDEVENLTGDPDALIAFVFISGKRVIPGLTLEAVESIDVSGLMVVEQGDEGESDAAPLAVTPAPPGPRAKRK